jgi:glyoxylase-like metal-dependent hydrolase (beta-lactamase superfamily II)
MSFAHFFAALVATIAVARGIVVIPGGFVPGSQPDGNTVVLQGKNGLIVVDTGRHAEQTRRIVELARSRRQPVAAIINTH